PFTPPPEPQRPPPAADPPTAMPPAMSAAAPAPHMPSRFALRATAAAWPALPADGRQQRARRRPPSRSGPRLPRGRGSAVPHLCGAGGRGRRQRAPPRPNPAPPTPGARCAAARTSVRCAPRGGPPGSRSAGACSCRSLRLRGRRRRFVAGPRLAQLPLQVLGGSDVCAQRLRRLLAPRTDPLAGDFEPRSALLDEAALHAEIEQFVRPGDAHSVENVELRFPEGRRHLVLHHFHPRPVADHLIAVLDGADAADVET